LAKSLLKNKKILLYYQQLKNVAYCHPMARHAELVSASYQCCNAFDTLKIMVLLNIIQSEAPKITDAETSSA